MDKLLKSALDGDAVGFIDRLKGKMAGDYSDKRTEITATVAAGMAGVKVQEKEEKAKGIEVDYTSGMKSTRKTKKFKSQAAYEKWLDKNEGDIEVNATRGLED